MLSGGDFIIGWQFIVYEPPGEKQEIVRIILLEPSVHEKDTFKCQVFLL